MGLKICAVASQVVRMLQLSSGHSGIGDKQQQEHNSPNVGTKVLPTPVHALTLTTTMNTKMS